MDTLGQYVEIEKGNPKDNHIPRVFLHTFKMTVIPPQGLAIIVASGFMRCSVLKDGSA